MFIGISPSRVPGISFRPGAGGGAVDAHFDNVALLIAADTLLVDQSKHGQVAVPRPGVLTETGGYITLDGTTQYITWVDDPSLELGAGDWTMEIFGASFDVDTRTHYLLTKWGASSWSYLWRFEGGATPKRMAFFRSTIGTDSASVTFNWAPVVGQDYNLCLERSGDTYRFYVDGVMIASATLTGAIADIAGISPRLGGSEHDTANEWDGKFQAARVTIGTARYASDSGYTVPTLPLLTGATGLAGERIVPGVWSWFSDPRAIVYSNKLSIQAVQRDGNDGHLHAFEGVSPYGRGEFTRTILKTNIDNDDHNLGSFVARVSDNKILAAYAGHNSVGLWTRLSTTAASIAAMDAEANLDASLGNDQYTYPSLIQLEGETNDPIYLFYRAIPGAGGDRQRWYSVSTDGGVTWSAGTQFLANTGASTWPPYVLAVKNGTDRIDFVCTDGSPNDKTTNSVYHFYWQAGSFRNTAGTALTLPITPSTDLTKVYDGTTNRAWIWDIKINSVGRPVIAYTAFLSTTDHRYRRAEYNGTSWDDEEIVAGGGYLYSGEPYYSGGICIDPANMATVYCSIKDGSGIHQIWKYTKSGGVWSGTQLTTNVRSSFRPFIPSGLRRLLYCNGLYTTFEDFYTHVVAHDIA